MVLVTATFGNTSLATVGSSAISITVEFPKLQVGGAGGLQSKYFVTNGESSQVVTGLAGKTAHALSIDGQILTYTLNAQWTYTKSTGAVNFVNDIPAGLEGLIFYSNN